jgi:hypothetical protein
VRRAAGLIGATLLSAILLAACGGGSSAGLIPTGDAVGLGNDLSALESALSSHSCDDTQTALNDIFTDISTLPTSVNTKLRDNLLGGYEQLDNTARTQCQAKTHTHTHTTTGPTGPTGPTHSTTSATGPTQSTSATGPTQSTSATGPTQSTSSTGPTLGGGSQAPTGSSGATSADVGAGGVASAP